MPSNAEEFKAGQKASWSSVAQGWRRWWATFEDGAQALSDRLVELAEIRPGDRVLDIATGIGEPAITAARKVQPNGKVIATDISPEMLAIAKERSKELGLERIVVFEESDAESYAYPSSSFDAVISRWGLMFLPNLIPTLQKIRESLMPKGILAAAVWSVPENAPVLMAAFKTAALNLGTAPPSAGSPGPFRLADMKNLEDLFKQSGFKDTRTEKMRITFRFNSADDFASFHRAINAPISAMLKNQPSQKHEQIWNAISDAAKHYADNKGRVTFDNEVICIAGQR